MQDKFLKKVCVKGVRKGWLLTELRDMCGTLKLPTKGDKETLCKRISDYFNEKQESTTFIDFVKDNNIEKVKEFSGDTLIQDEINEAKDECLNYGYLELYKYLETFPSEYQLTLDKIFVVLNKGNVQFVTYLYNQFQKSQKNLEIANLADRMYLLFHTNKTEIPNNYIKYIELSKMLKNNAELVKQIELFSSL